MPALVGGGLRAKPGEISLAHHGVLFLDEFPEFQPAVLDSLRQPLENGDVTIVRANYRVTYPARFMLVAAMNPCRCGKANDPGFTCRRGENERCAADYQGRLSGPLIDRIDLHIEVPAVTAADLILPAPAEGSREVAARVARARDMQCDAMRRWAFPASAPTRRRSGPALEEVAKLDSAGLGADPRCRRRDAALGARLSPRAARRAHARRSRRRGENRPRASRRGAVLSGAGRRGAPRRVNCSRQPLAFRTSSARSAAPRSRSGSRNRMMRKPASDNAAWPEKEDQRRPEADPECLCEERKRHEASRRETAGCRRRSRCRTPDWPASRW